MREEKIYWMMKHMNQFLFLFVFHHFLFSKNQTMNMMMRKMNGKKKKMIEIKKAMMKVIR